LALRNSCKSKETKAKLKESIALRRKVEAFKEFEETKSVLLNLRTEQSMMNGITVRRTSVDLTEDQNYQNVLNSTQRGRELQQKATEQESKLQHFERMYQDMVHLVEKFERNDEISEDQLLSWIEMLRKLRESIDRNAAEYIKTKEKVVEAFELAQKFKQKLNTEQKKLIQNELERMLSPRSAAPIQTTPKSSRTATRSHTVCSRSQHQSKENGNGLFAGIHFEISSAPRKVKTAQSGSPAVVVQSKTSVTGKFSTIFTRVKTDSKHFLQVFDLKHLQKLT
jgi:hypothetical protein